MRLAPRVIQPASHSTLAVPFFWDVLPLSMTFKKGYVELTLRYSDSALGGLLRVNWSTVFKMWPAFLGSLFKYRSLDPITRSSCSAKLANVLHFHVQVSAHKSTSAYRRQFWTPELSSFYLRTPQISYQLLCDKSPQPFYGHSQFCRLTGLSWAVLLV